MVEIDDSYFEHGWMYNSIVKLIAFVVVIVSIFLIKR